MMRIDTVCDVDFRRVGEQRYQLDLFASGSESRATAVVKKLNTRNFDDIGVLGFSTRAEMDSRKMNDSTFRRSARREISVADASDDAVVLRMLESHIGGSQHEAFVLVDCSVMVRTWYAAVLNWGRYACRTHRLVIDFVYAGGLYPKEYPPRVISGIHCIPGCEGHPDPISPSAAIFGLAFDGSASMAVLDYLEPDRVFAFGADAPMDPGAARAKEANGQLP